MKRFLFLALLAVGVWTGAVKFRFDWPALESALETVAHPQAVTATDEVLAALPADSPTAQQMTRVLTGTTILLFCTTVYRLRRRGLSTQAAIQTAALPVLSQPAAPPPAAQRASAKALRAQLLADQIGVEQQFRKMPEEVARLERENAQAHRALLDAERNYQAKEEVADKAEEALKAALARRDALARERAEIAEALHNLPTA